MQYTLQQWEEKNGYVIKDKSGLSSNRKYTDREIKDIASPNNITGVKHEDRWSYLKKNGYNDPKYLVERTPQEVEEAKGNFK